LLITTNMGLNWVDVNNLDNIFKTLHGMRNECSVDKWA
jgi:hypothetical protein